MKVFIYAYEDHFQGLHGAYLQCVTEVEDIEEAEGIAYDMSAGLVDSYGYLFDELEDDEFEEEGLEWIIYKIRDDVTLSTEDLDEICAQESYQDFAEKYCDKEEL